MDKTRIDILEYGKILVEAAMSRSEDRFNKCGCVLFNDMNRVISTGYNGLPPGYELPESIANSREARISFMTHAEQNACAYATYGQVTWAYTTLCPCTSCMHLLVAHGVKRIVYLKNYERDPYALHLGEIYDIEMVYYDVSRRTV